MVKDKSFMIFFKVCHELHIWWLVILKDNLANEESRSLYKAVGVYVNKSIKDYTPSSRVSDVSFTETLHTY